MLQVPGGNPLETPLTDILFHGSTEDHENLRALYVIAGEYIQQKRQRIIRRQKQEAQKKPGNTA